MLGSVTNALSFTWSNAPAGLHELRARAHFNTGSQSTPPPLRVIVGRLTGVLTFGLDRLEPLNRPLFGIALWQYLAFLIYLALAFLLAKLLDYLVRGRLKKLAKKTSTKLDDLLQELLGVPIKVIAFVILLHVGLRLFPWPEWLEDFLSKGMTVVLACSLTYVALKAVNLLMNFWRLRTHREEDRIFNDQLYPVITKSLKIFLVIIAVLLTCSNLGLNITSLIASLSVVGLALGLAAQDTVANVFGAVTVFADKPFRIGDRIKLEGVDGIVESIGLRSTRVRNADGHLITVPNKTMGNATITNISRQPTIRTLMNVGLTYDTSSETVQKAVSILEDVLRSDPKTHDLTISFNQFGDSALNLQIVHWWAGTDPREHLQTLQQLNLKIKERFDQEKISFAFPSRTLYLRHEGERNPGGDAKR